MNKGVRKSNTGYKGLADISTIQGFEPHPRFGYGTRNYLHGWVVRDSNYISFIGHIWIQLILIHNPY
jgi:hypothetical protein